MKRALLVTGLMALGAATAAGAQLRGIEVRAGALAALSKRNAAFGGAVGTGSGTMSGMDLTVRAKWFGAEARVFGGDFTADSGATAAGTIANGDLRLMAGPRTVAAEVGYGRRGFTGALTTITWSFIRIGARASLPLGGSGLHAGVALALYTGVSGAGGAGKGNGKEAETSLTYAPERLPLYLMFGYRREQFTATAASGDRPEELSGIVVGGGVRLGR